MKPEHERLVIEAIDKTYEIDSFMGWDGINGRALIGHEVGDVIFGLAHSLAARYYEDNKRGTAVGRILLPMVSAATLTLFPARALHLQRADI